MVIDLIIGIVVVVLVLVLLVKLFRGPLKWIWKLLLNTLGGFVALFILNLFGGLIGLTLELNWINAAVAGILGLPGIIILLLIEYL
jgi:inhibitor of the pro-sigma K processing machinery